MGNMTAAFRNRTKKRAKTKKGPNQLKSVFKRTIPFNRREQAPAQIHLDLTYLARHADGSLVSKPFICIFC